MENKGKFGVKRRTFLKLTGAAFAAAALSAGCAPGAPEVTETEEPITEETVLPLAKGEWIPSGCAGCTSWCAKEIYVVDGRAVKIRSNSRSMVHRGNSCPKTHLALQQVYDPDRVKVPMKRTNPLKGKDQDPGFVPITWDEAAETIADKLMELRENNETHKFVLMRGRYTQLNQLLYGRMPAILGSPNNISHSSICAEAEKFGSMYTEGYWNYRDYDVENTRYVLVWGCDPLSSNRQVSHYLNAWGDLLERAEVAVVDPRLSATASKANHWLPVKPGEDTALALALAHVILTEGLWNRDFVGDFTDGENHFRASESVDDDIFEEKHTYGLISWWNLELKDCSPEWAEEKTGVTADKIRSVAKRMGEVAPHVIVWLGGGPAMQVRGGYAAMAVHALNGLLGSADNVGGTMRGASVPSKSFPSVDDFLDEITGEGVKHKKIDQRGYKEFPALASARPGSGVVTNRVADAILAEDPYDIKVAFAYWNNFNFSCPEPERWDRAMAKVPFFVHAITHASEMTMFADIVLPSTHHMFEQWGYLNQKGAGYTHCWLARPVIETVWDCKDPETEVVWMIAEKLAAKGFTNLLDYCKSIRDPETGAAPQSGKELAEFACKYRLQPIWDPSEYLHGERFNGWQDFKAAGVWNSEKYTFKTTWDDFGTATGKFEFYSATLKEALETHAANHNTTVDDILTTCKYIATGERAFIPHYEPPYMWGEKEEYPLVLVDYKSRMNREGRSANCNWYYELKDVDPGDEKWDDVAKINPRDAEAMGLRGGAKVKLISPTGSLECTLKLWEGVPPGTVSKTFGQGHWAYGRIASLNFQQRLPRGGNNNDILPADYERLSGSSAFYALTRVRIEAI